MDITLQLDKCSARRFSRNCILSLNFVEKTWSARGVLEPGIPGAWPEDLNSQFSKYGDFEVKDNGVIWIWDTRSRIRGMPQRLNTLILRDAPTGESDTVNISGTVRVFDPPNAGYKDLVFPWVRTGVVVPHCCGPDVTNQLIGVLKTVVADYDKLGKVDTGLQWVGMGFWNIDALRERVALITPANCGCPKGTDCEGSVTVFGKCFRAGIVNYTLYGVIEGLIKGRVTGSTLHALYWAGKVIGNIATLNPDAVADAPHIGYLESKMVNAGLAFTRGGGAAMKTEFLSIPSLACAPSYMPPKPFGWRYTWAPNFMDQPSRY